MNILDIKKDVETYFHSNYSETDVHWAGMKFDTSAFNEWVHIEYLGEYISDCGLDNTSFKHSGSINITVLAETTFRVSEIASIIISMFKGENINGTITRRAMILEQSYDDTLDKSYMVIEIETSSL